MESAQEGGFTNKIRRAAERASEVVSALEAFSHSIAVKATRDAISSLHDSLPGTEQRNRWVRDEALRRARQLTRELDDQLKEAVRLDVEVALREFKGSSSETEENSK